MRSEALPCVRYRNNRVTAGQVPVADGEWVANARRIYIYTKNVLSLRVKSVACPIMVFNKATFFPFSILFSFSRFSLFWKTFGVGHLSSVYRGRRCILNGGGGSTCWDGWGHTVIGVPFYLHILLQIMWIMLFWLNCLWLCCNSGGDGTEPIELD